MNCDAALEMIALGHLDDEGVQAHLVVCPQCRVRTTSAVRLGKHLSDPLMWEEPPASLRQRVVEAVAGEPGASRSRRPWWWAVAAALVSLVVAAAVYVPNRPDWAMDLEAMPAAPGASARVRGWNMDHGTRMVFEVDGLDPTGPDAYYEIWLTAPDGRHVSAGTFRMSGRFEVMAGVRRSDFPRIWITRERADDDPGPFSETVFDTAPT